MKVLILAAGYGTRLYPRTRSKPKPLLKIGSRPIINYLLPKIEELSNISRIIVVTNQRFYKQFQSWRDNLKTRYPVCILNDLTTSPKDRLGAIGDLDFVCKSEGITEDFLVLGGDNLFSGSLRDFVRFAKSKLPFSTIGVFDINNKKEACHYGVVNLGRGSRVSQLQEKPLKPKSSLVAMCLYYFPRGKLKLIKEYLKNFSHSRDTTGSYIHWLSRRDKVYGFVFKDLWFDIGHIGTFRKVEEIVERGGGNL